MKKLITILAIGLCFASCSKEGKESKGYPTPEKGKTYILEGTVGTPGFTWETSSSIGLYSAMDEVKAMNLECKIDGWADTKQVDPETGEPVPYTPSEYEGQAVAPFNTPALDLVKGPNKFVLYTPYNPTLKYVAGVIYGLEVAEEQTQPKADVAGAGFAFGVCEGIPGVDETFPFTLNPVSAIAKVSVSSTEFADYGVKRVTIWDEAGAAKLGGGFNVNVEQNSFQTLATYSRVSTEVLAPAAMGNKTQNVYISILPGEYQNLYVIVELTGDKGNVTIPLKKESLSFTGGKTTEITLSDLKSSDNTLAWYCPVENRLQSGLGYAYGDANTYFIQCKSGSTYTGATYTANADIPDEVTIDYRARGSFFAVEEPVGVTFEWFKNNGTVYTPRTADYSASAVDPTAFTITPDEANYKVKVKNTGAFAGAPILLMKKGEKILWAWAFWNIAADGTKVEPVSVGTYQFANMDIGQPTTNYAKWVANATPAGNPDVIFRCNYYYQYGRPIPTFWTTYWSFTWDPISTDFTGTGNVPGIQGPISLEDAISHPVGIILAYPNESNLPSWTESDKRGDLWGGSVRSDDTDPGTKSIYDPCPKGWRVPSYAALSALNEAAANATYENTNGMVGFYINNVLFATNGYGNGKTASNGRLASMGMGNTGKAAQTSHGLLWSNYLGSHKSNQPGAFYYRDGANKSGNKMAKYNSSISASIRCMVDEANR